MRGCCTLIALLSLAPAAIAQRIAVLGDEWMLSNNAFTNNAPAAQQLASQLGVFIANGQANANFLVLSNHPMMVPTLTGPSVGGSSIATYMTNQGYTWTHNPNATFNLATLQSFDGVILCDGPGSGAGNASILAQYVNGGGSVVIVSGTNGFGGAVGEAAAWNPFLNMFNLQLNAPYIGPTGTIQLPVVPNSNPVGTGLPSVRFGFGHMVSEIVPSNPNTDIVQGNFTSFGTSGVQGVIGTYQVVPAPGTIGVLAAAGLAAARRRRRIQRDAMDR